jgi:hypothetical protein
MIMRPRYKPPLKKRYFHTKRKIDKKDMIVTKKKIESINQKRLKRELEDKEKKLL